MNPIIKRLLPTGGFPVFRGGEITESITTEWGDLDTGNTGDVMAGVADAMALANSTFSSHQSDETTKATALISNAAYVTMWAIVGVAGVVLTMRWPVTIILIGAGAAGVYFFRDERNRQDRNNPERLKHETAVQMAKLRVGAEIQKRAEVRQDMIRVMENTNRIAGAIEDVHQERQLLPAPKAPKLLPAPKNERLMIEASADDEIEVTYDRHKFANNSR